MLTVAPEAAYESLASVGDADLYHAKFGNPTWAGASEEAKEAALRRGTQYILARQVRHAYLNPVHPNVVAATAEAALRALDGSLYTDVTDQAVTREEVGSIAVTYATPTNGGRKVFPVIDDLLYGMTGGARPGKLALERA